jgi:hypothetical protein
MNFIQSQSFIWILISLVYLVLAVKNGYWLYKLKRNDEKSQNSLYITPDGINISSKGKEDPDSISVLNLFRSVLITDSAALFLGLIAAITSVVF